MLEQALGLVYPYFPAIICVLFLFGFLLVGRHLDRRTTRAFLLATVCVALLIVADVGEAAFIDRTSPSIWRVFFSVLGYSVRSLSIPIILLISQRNLPRWVRWLCFVPAIVNALVSCTAFFSHICFFYSENNDFVRGPLGFISFYVAGIYLLALLLFTVLRRQKHHRRELLTVLMALLTMLLSTGVTFVLDSDGAICCGIAISLTFYYLYFFAHQISYDELTGALTRRCFYLDTQRNTDGISAVISIDMNDLKYLNDHFGHQAGDAALTAVAEAMQQVLPGNATLYRVGGDEFLVLCRGMTCAELDGLTQALRQSTGETGHICAIGYALYHSQTGLDRAVNEADAQMYQNKAVLKQNCAEQKQE